MGIVNLKALQVSNADANVRLDNGPELSGGVLKEYKGTVTAGAADSNASTYRICRIPSNLNINQVLLANEANTSGTSYKIGFAYPTSDPVKAGAVILDNALIAAGFSMATARAQLTDITHTNATTFDLDKPSNTPWQLAGLAADPGGQFDVIITAVTAGSAGGKMLLLVRGTN